MKIMLVDDSKAMRLIVRRALREAGFGHHEISEANNGAEALAAIRAQRPDVVLSDWNMPEMNGIQLLDALVSEGASLKFGFVTSEGTQEMQEQAKQNGAQFYIVKPFTAEVFQEVLTPFLGRG